MAGLRGYPQPGYKAAARDFQQSPPPSPKKAVSAANDNLQAANDNALGPVIQNLSSLTGYSQSTIEAVIAAAEEVAEQGSTVAKRVPARLLPVLNAFLLGYDLANLGIDWYRQITNLPEQDANGWWINPNLSGYSEYCRYSTGNVWTQTESACGSIAFANGVTAGGSDWHGVQGVMNGTSAVNECIRADFTWLSPNYYRDERVALLYPIPGAEVPDLGDPSYRTSQAAAPAVAPAIPYKLIPYVNPAPVAPTLGDQPSPGWYLTNAPAPAEASGTKPAPPGTQEKKKQLTAMGHAAMRVAKGLINAATESCDAIDAMWDAVSQEARINYGYQYEKVKYKRALPTVQGSKGKVIKDGLGRPVVESSRLSRISCTRKAKAFADNPRLVDDIDWTKAINNLIVNQIEDAVFGFVGKKANDAFVNTPGYNRPVGLGTGTVF